MKARKYKLAYTLYIDMKRRGLKPNLRTFVTILTGYSRIDDWDTHTKQLANVHTLFDNYKQFVEAVREQDSRSPDISRVPYILYIKILGDATLYQKMFDVFYAMDQEGPLSPDHFIYATLLHAIADRRVLSEGSQEPVSVQNASDAKLVWKQMVKASEKLGFPIDAYALTGVLKALSGGRPTDQLLAFDIVRDYVGLSKPGETALPTKVPLNDFILQVVLGLCIVTRKYRLCMHYFQQVIDRPTKPGQERIITWRHMEQVLRAYVAIAALGSMGEANQALETLEWMLREEIKDPNSGYKIRPRLETYGLVLSACWRGADWVSATRTFELMTGYNGKDFRDGKTGAPRMEKRSKGRNIMPNSAVLSTLARAAVASKDRANMRQCLRIIDHLQGAEFFVNVNETRKGEAHPNELVTKAMIRGKWEVKDRIFYNLKLASAIVELTDNATPKGKSRARLEAAEGEGVEDKGYVISANEEQQWTALKMKAKDYIKRTPAPRPGSIPIMEKEPLGPAKFITNTDNQVEYQMTHRHIKSI
ncbi:hypothetical protein EW026_g427 [Hermanssonia centrifuga]|uniref:Pentatricopeptide repeat-containing protein n=1 Tax=Hermanssonia centrifuga TaxID=98765 RepID=A0A4S4KUL7_9APHY|nr:hypothetical protein EW026_g427 [Hermanssonia centrifuga]